MEHTPPELGWRRPQVRPAAERLLGLLVEREALSTGQLQRLTGSPQRTVQYRLAGLARRGLVGRMRPVVGRGTSPSLWWATPLGARAVSGSGSTAAVDADPGTAAADRGLARVSAVVAMNELRLGLHEADPTVGVRLRSWQRTPNGVALDGVRRLATDARFTVETGAGGSTPVCVGGLVYLDSGLLPRTRLVGPLSAFARLAGSATRSGGGPVPGPLPWLLVLTRQPGRADAWLTAADEVIARPPSGLDPWAALAAAGRMTVCAYPSAATSVLDLPWQRPGAGRPARLPDLLHLDVFGAAGAGVGPGRGEFRAAR